jgi:hypothetical protein
MRTPLKVLRGLLGLGAAGAVAGGGVLAALATILELLDWGATSLGFIGYAFLAGAGIGLAVTTAFGVVLALTARGRRVEDLSFWRATTVSAVLGAFLPVAIGAVGGDAVSPLLVQAPAIVIGGLFGAFLGGGLVGLGKRARLREIAGETAADQKLVEQGERES